MKPELIKVGFFRWIPAIIRFVEGDVHAIPRGMGLICWAYDRDGGWYCPIPFNLLLGLLVKIWWKCKHGINPSKYRELKIKYERSMRGRPVLLGKLSKYRAAYRNILRTLFSEKECRRMIEEMEELDETNT